LDGERIAGELEAAGGKGFVTQADVGTEAACLGFVNGAAEMFGRLDILVINAGIRKYEKVDEASAESWNEIVDVNLKSFAFCAKAVGGGHPGEHRRPWPDVHAVPCAPHRGGRRDGGAVQKPRPRKGR
jgi:NAD(P)-dependent dehydrogenase (short-subunit alcohol dehydrogenase family)